jgi:hypothetical protein
VRSVATTRATALAARRRSDVKHGDPPARGQHAPGLQDRRDGVRHDSEQEVEHDGIERAIRNVEPVGVEDTDIGACEPERVGTVLGPADHGRREVSGRETDTWR